MKAEAGGPDNLTRYPEAEHKRPGNKADEAGTPFKILGL